MALDEKRLLQIEELKEIGNDYRYREQLMVQEFGFSMVVTGVVASFVLHDPTSTVSFVAQCYGLLFLVLLTLHLRNLNEDRRAAGLQRNTILKELGFFQTHQGIDRVRKSMTFLNDVSAPRNMVRYAGLVTVGWAIWAIVTATSHWQ
ncbi:MAG: hypothetical protein JSR81_04645 [Proteobacteria bacterium]|nr:hypothetical protein [Pseudomonadota bacterium]